MRITLFACLLLFACASLADGDLVLNLTAADSRLRVILVNRTDQPILINKRFSIASQFDLGEMYFQINNCESGKAFPFASKVRIGAPDREDFMVLSPADLVGREVDLEQLAEDHLMDNGKYCVKAVYRNKHESRTGNAFKEILESNIVEVNVDPSS